MRKFFPVAAVFLQAVFFLEVAQAAQYTGDGYRDPFTESPMLQRLPEAPQEELDAPVEIRLDGIIWVPEKPRAIINGRRVTEGAEVDGAKVVEILRKEVRIIFNGQNMVLRDDRTREEKV